MIRTGRFTLTDEPQRVDVVNDDDVPGRSTLVIAQESGTLIVCDDIDGYVNGARIPVIAGQTIEFGNLLNHDAVWLAAPADLDVDTVEIGVS